MNKSLLTGNVKEDEKEAFESLCKELDLNTEEVKGVGYANRLMYLCQKAKLKLTLDYNLNMFSVEYASKTDVPTEPLEVPEVVTNIVETVGGKMVDGSDEGPQDELENLLG